MKDRLALFYSHNALDCRGGAERKLLLLARHFAGYPGVELEIDVLNFEPARTFQEYLPGLKIKTFSAEGWLSKFFYLWQMAKNMAKADLIHAHNHPGHIAAALAKIIRKKPVVWFCNEPMLYLEGTRQRTPWLKLAPVRLLEKIILPQIDIIVANSENTRGNIKKYLGRNSVVIYSGVDTDLLKPAKARAASARPQFVSLSRFTAEKNLDFILRLAEKCPEFDFVIAGNGNLENHIREEIQKNNLANTRLAVNISEAEKVRLYQASDAFLFPTPNEPLGINIVEAMACGLPTVAFNSGGAKETVAAGATGFLVETGEEFEARVRELAVNAELRDKLGAAARARAVEIFSLEQMVYKTTSIYNQLLARYGQEFRFPEA